MIVYKVARKKRSHYLSALVDDPMFQTSYYLGKTAHVDGLGSFCFESLERAQDWKVKWEVEFPLVILRCQAWKIHRVPLLVLRCVEDLSFYHSVSLRLWKKIRETGDWSGGWYPELFSNPFGYAPTGTVLCQSIRPLEEVA